MTGIPLERPDTAAASWPTPVEGATYRIVKLSPEGEAVTEYPGVTLPERSAGRWLCVEAEWTFRSLNIDGLIFEPGDRLLEWFSPDHWFNVFAVHAPDGEYRGCYANVTYPAIFDPETLPPTVAWHDLWLDVILLPDGTSILRDEDELEESGLIDRDPVLHARIMAGLAVLRDHLARGEAPFDRVHSIR